MIIIMSSCDPYHAVSMALEGVDHFMGNTALVMTLQYGCYGYDR